MFSVNMSTVVFSPVTMKMIVFTARNMYKLIFKDANRNIFPQSYE